MFAMTLVDLRELLGEEEGRQFVLSLVPRKKRAELEFRVQRRIDDANTSDWTEIEVRRLLDFFGIIDDVIVLVEPQPLTTIVPEYNLFDHQRSAVNKLIPLLTQDERRAILHFQRELGKHAQQCTLLHHFCELMNHRS